mmetsp:Transcript_20031/g.51206  ORF Transcript_20031/g.51206 Transcript_20031/m.51206 type:complete len:853 (+) Transcript_20031:145-2703(+)
MDVLTDSEAMLCTSIAGECTDLVAESFVTSVLRDLFWFIIGFAVLRLYFAGPGLLGSWLLGAKAGTRLGAKPAALTKARRSAAPAARAAAPSHQAAAEERNVAAGKALRAQPRSYGGNEALLKNLVKDRDSKVVVEVFRTMQQDGFYASEGLCGSLLSKCGEGHNLALADEIAAYLRDRRMTTLATYKTLMKVYASSGLYDRACDLYDQIRADGIEPDHVMYGCLVKFAVKCGRTELSRALFEGAKGGGVRNYMWLIRAAGQAGDAEEAISLLRRFLSSQGQPDPIAFNCVLDACVVSGDMVRCEEIFGEMRAEGLLSTVAYNTMIKGYCAKGELRCARRVLDDMDATGVSPDSATFNCLLGAAIAGSHLDSVWDLLSEMDRRGIALDRYSVSILMKAVRKARTPAEARQALALLDRPGVNVCEDDILFNTVLDACIRRRDSDHLRKVLNAYDRSHLQPSVHTYGLLIKASSQLKLASRCNELFREMVEQRGLQPNDITFSCMLDALVNAGRVKEAAELCEEWRSRIPPNTVMYATLIKGYASTGNATAAMDVYRQLQKDDLRMNHVSYTTLIDAQARAGDMELAMQLLRQMERDGCQPNTITYSALVRSYCQPGDLGAALRTFKEMVSRGLPADAVIFNTLLDGCVRHFSFELADQLVNEMRAHAVEPTNVTLSIVVRMWGKRRQLDKAFEVVRRGLAGCSPRLDAQVGTCLVGACLHNNDVDRALEAFEEIRSWRGCGGPDSGAYNALVAGLVRHGRCPEAMRLAEEAHKLATARGSTFKPLKQETLRVLFRAMHQELSGGRATASPQLAEELRAAAAPVPAGEGNRTYPARSAKGRDGAPRASWQRSRS